MACACLCFSSFESALRKGDVEAALAHLGPDPLTIARTYFRLGNTLWHVVAKAGHEALMQALAERLSAAWPAPPAAANATHGGRHRNGPQGPSQRQEPSQGQRQGAGQGQGAPSAGQSESEASGTAGGGSAGGGGGVAAAAAGNFQRRSNPFQRLSDGLVGRRPDPSQQPLADFVSAANVMGHTPLMMACQGGHTGCVKLLLSLGANPWCRDRGNCTALHHAALRDQGGCIEAVLQHPASARPPPGTRQTLVRLVDLPNFCGYTPAHFAAAASRPAALEALLAGGGNIAARCWAEGLDWISGPRGSTPLHFAARRGDEDMCKVILRHYFTVLRDSGAVDPRLHADVRGWRPFQLAIDRRRRELVEMLNPQTPLTVVFAGTDVVRMYKVPKLKALAAAALQGALLTEIDRVEEEVVQRRARLAAAAAAAAAAPPARAASGASAGVFGSTGGADSGAGGLSRGSSLAKTFSGALRSVRRQSMQSVRTLRELVKGSRQGWKLSTDRLGSSNFTSLMSRADEVAAAAAAAAVTLPGGVASGYGGNGYGTNNGSALYDSRPQDVRRVGNNNGDVNGSGGDGLSVFRTAAAAVAAAAGGSQVALDGVMEAGPSRVSAVGDSCYEGVEGRRSTCVTDVGSVASNVVSPLAPGGEWPRTVTESVTSLPPLPSWAGTEAGGGLGGPAGGLLGYTGIRYHAHGGLQPSLPGGVSPVRGMSLDGDPLMGDISLRGPTPAYKAAAAATAAAVTAAGASGSAGAELPVPLPLLSSLPLTARLNNNHTYAAGAATAASSAGGSRQVVPLTRSNSGIGTGPSAAPSVVPSIIDLAPSGARHWEDHPHGSGIPSLPPLQHAPSIPQAVPPRQPQQPPEPIHPPSPFAMPSIQSQPLSQPSLSYAAAAPGVSQGCSPQAANNDDRTGGGGGSSSSYPAGHSPPCASKRPAVPVQLQGLLRVNEDVPSDAEPVDPVESGDGKAAGGAGAGAAAAAATTRGGLFTRSQPVATHSPASSLAVRSVPRFTTPALAPPEASQALVATLASRPPGAEGLSPYGTASGDGDDGAASAVVLGAQDEGVDQGCSAYGGMGAGLAPAGSSPKMMSMQSSLGALGLGRKSRERRSLPRSHNAAADSVSGLGGTSRRGSARPLAGTAAGTAGLLSPAASGVGPSSAGPGGSGGGNGCSEGPVIGSDTSEDFCGICFERVACLQIRPCNHALCAECSREVTRMLESRAPTCPFCRGMVRGFAACWRR